MGQFMRNVDIAICFDRQMETAALVTLSSLKRWTREETSLKIYAITDGATNIFKATTGAMLSRNFSVEIIEVENNYKNLRTTNLITSATYLRFVLPEILNGRTDKVLYLDADVIARRDVASLYNTSIEGYALAAVPDFSQIYSGITWEPWRIEYNKNKFRFSEYCREILNVGNRENNTYFNAGVILINVDKWRAQKISERSIDFLAENPDLIFLDQDALNYVVKDQYCKVDVRWNAFATHACRLRGMRMLDRLSVAGRHWQTVRALWGADPWLVHYAGPNKPWSPTEAPTPLDSMWWDEANTLPFCDDLKTAHRTELKKAGHGIDKSLIRSGSGDMSRTKPSLTKFLGLK